MDSLELLRAQLRAFEEGRAHALITIVEVDGSTPRASGKMLVYEDGTSLGTIGGGEVELLAGRDALSAISSGQNLCRSYDLSTPGIGMTCGGHVRVLIEPFKARPLLVMCGAGHVGGKVLQLAGFLGFDTLLLDDRDETQISDKIQLAHRFVPVRDFARELLALDIAPGAYYVIATHGHTFDGDALTAALQKRAAYVGMIGSRKKIAALFAELEKKGVARAALDTVYTPIGLDLGGETPEEIALAILAEILAVKNGRKGGSLRTN